MFIMLHSRSPIAARRPHQLMLAAFESLAKALATCVARFSYATSMLSSEDSHESRPACKTFAISSRPYAARPERRMLYISLFTDFSLPLSRCPPGQLKHLKHNVQTISCGSTMLSVFAAVCRERNAVSRWGLHRDRCEGSIRWGADQPRHGNAWTCYTRQWLLRQCTMYPFHGLLICMIAEPQSLHSPN